MKYEILLKRILGVSFVFALLMGCGTAATQSPTLAPSTSSPTVVVTLSPTPSAKPTMEKIWNINGSPNTFDRPTELALDSQGNVYVIDGGNQRIQKFDKDGNFILMWGSQGAGDGQFLFHVPPAHYGSIAVDKDGYVYVTDHFNRIQKFDSNGKFLMKFGDTGYADGKFDKPLSIALDRQGNIYVTDNGNNRIQKFDQNGKFLASFGPFSYPVGITLDPEGHIYVVEIVAATL